MNYIHIGGGWKGKEPDWDPKELIRAEGGYDADKRRIAESEMDQLIERTKELILENSERLGNDAGEAQVDRPWREPE